MKSGDFLTQSLSTILKFVRNFKKVKTNPMEIVVVVGIFKINLKQPLEKAWSTRSKPPLGQVRLNSVRSHHVTLYPVLFIPSTRVAYTLRLGW